jgi:NAD(P)H-hydrate repair Nnr-like enzyme with NAD(P)H-hydrate dehydratase domain
MHPELDPEFAIELLKAPGELDNKYSRGCVGFVTGSNQYPGAALLGINAAFELEVGMVQYQGPTEVSNLVLSSRPEVVLGLDKAEFLVIGSGISDTNQDQLEGLQAAVSSGKPLLVDGGAMTICDLSLISLGILTPHAKEAEKIFAKYGHHRAAKDISGNPVASAIELAEITGLVVLLKGSITVLAVAGERAIESGPGSAHLAQAGTGDLLAGMIGALSAKLIASGRSLNPKLLRDVALLANQLHSEAAELSAARGEFGASSICNAISESAGN